MTRRARPRIHRFVSALPLTLLGALSVLTLSGCPEGADLEHPERYGFVTAGSGSSVAGSGATGGSGGGSAGSGTGGSAGGTGMLEVPDCPNYATTLSKNCAVGGCHKGGGSSEPQSGLNLNADSGLVARLKDVMAEHGDIFCDGVPCTTPPSDCMPVKLVDSATPDNSWIIAKLRGTQGNCGDQMTGLSNWDDTQEKCIEAVVKAIAAAP